MTYIPAGIVIGIVTDDNSVITRGPSENTTVTNMVLDVADNSSFRDRSEGQDITNNKGSFLTTVHELTSVQALSSDEELILLLVPEGVAESDLGERRTTARIVDDIGDHTLKVTISLAEVEAAKPGRTLAAVGVGLEDGTSTLTLGTNHSSHGGLPVMQSEERGLCCG